VAVGDTFLIYDDQGAPPHLHIVITEPDESGLVVLVSVTSERAKSDTMVRLSSGDHPFIRHPSVITYAYSKLLSEARLRELVLTGEAFAREAASADLVRRLRAGMNETDRAPRDVQNFFRRVTG
jgi:hypothetical protein